MGRWWRSGFFAFIASISTLFIGPGFVSAQEKEVIKIGATAPITGGFADIYSIQGRLWEAWAAVQNEGGGIYVESLNRSLPIQIIYYDDQSDPRTSVRFYERLINEDEVDFLMGPPGSPIAFAATTVAERYRFPMILGASNDPEIYQRGFNYIQGVLDLGTQWSSQFFDMLAHKGEVDTIAIVTQDVLYAHGVAAGARQFAEDAGMVIVFDEIVPTDAEDFTAIISRIKAAEPDLVYVANFPPFYIKFGKQADELGLNPKAMHCSTCSAGSIREGLGSLAEQVTGEAFWDFGMTFGEYDKLEETLRRANLDPLEWTFALISIPALEVIRAGIEEAGTLDREEVFESIKALEVMTVMGSFKAKEDGIGSITPFPTQVQGGEVNVIWPPEAAVSDYIYPRQP